MQAFSSGARMFCSRKHHVENRKERRKWVYPKGYYFYSPLSSCVITSKMAVPVVRTSSFRPHQIRLHCRLLYAGYLQASSLGKGTLCFLLCSQELSTELARSLWLLLLDSYKTEPDLLWWILLLKRWWVQYFLLDTFTLVLSLRSFSTVVLLPC